MKVLEGAEIPLARVETDGMPLGGTRCYGSVLHVECAVRGWACNPRPAKEVGRPSVPYSRWYRPMDAETSRFSGGLGYHA